VGTPTQKGEQKDPTEKKKYYKARKTQKDLKQTQGARRKVKNSGIFQMGGKKKRQINGKKDPNDMGVTYQGGPTSQIQQYTKPPQSRSSSMNIGKTGKTSLKNKSEEIIRRKRGSHIKNVYRNRKCLGGRAYTMTRTRTKTQLFGRFGRGK